MTYTEEQLKAALVRTLPDKLRGYRNPQFKHVSYHWCDTPGAIHVTPHEWPAIVDLVQDTLSLEDYKRFITARIVVSKTTNCDIDKCRSFDKWQTRAQALADIGAINPTHE